MVVTSRPPVSDHPRKGRKQRRPLQDCLVPRVFTPGVAALLVLGVVAYLLAMLCSVAAGGLDVRESCNRAMAGVWAADHHASDPFQVEHHYLLPHATCRWSDGQTAPLMHVAPLPLIGPVVICACSITIIGRLLRRRHHRRRRGPEWPRFDIRTGDRQPWS